MLMLSILLLLMSNAVSIRRDKSILFARSSLNILASCFFISLDAFDLKLHEKGIGLFSGLFQTTSISIVFHIFVFIVTLLTLQLSGFYPRKVWKPQFNSFFKLLSNKIIYYNSFILNKMSEQYRIIEYSLIVLFVLIGGVFLMSSSDFMSIFLSLELQSYALYILCVVYRDSERATTGGLTYFLLGGLSSCFVLLAFGLLYGNSGNTGFDGLYTISNISGASITENSPKAFESLLQTIYQSYYLSFSLTIMSVGLLFKISAAPFHFWSPDVYDAIPTIVTTFVSTFAKISILVLLLEIVHYTTNSFSFLDNISNKQWDMFSTQTSDFSWTFSLLLSSFLSLIIGAILGLTQFRVKRLYAYSTISHLGFILLALSINSVESIESFIFYLMQYSITNLNAFIILIAIGYKLYLYMPNSIALASQSENKKNEALCEPKAVGAQNERLFEKENAEIDKSDKDNSPVQLLTEMKGYFYMNPYLSLSLAVTLFSFVGIPPLIGFFAKQMVLSSALDNGYIFIVLIAILSSVVSAYYYLVLVKQIFFEKSDYMLNPALKTTTLKVKFKKTNINPFARDETSASQDKDVIINTDNIQLSSFLTISVSILTLIILLFILIPQEWLSMATILALSIFNS